MAHKMAHKKCKYFEDLIHLNIFSDESPSFNWKPRPVYSEFGTTSDFQHKKPQDCLPVLLKYLDGEFVSPCTDFEPIPFCDEDSERNFRANYCTDFGEGSEYNFFDNQWCYFFFKPEEINRAAGVEIDRKPGFNHWNAMKLRYEPEGFVVENSLYYEKYYAIPAGIFPVCFQFDFATETFSSPMTSGLPTFTIDEMKSSWCFSKYFESHQSKWDWNEYTFVIYFTSSELRAAGIEVPEDPTTGFKFNSYKVKFKEVKKPSCLCGWDHVTRTWMPLCKCEKCIREPGKFAFDWRKNGNWLGNPVYSHHVRTDSDAFLLHDKRYMDRLFSIYGGPYCSNNCYCYTCERHQPPCNFEKEDECKFCCKVSPGSDSSDSD
jgi:hypothetical protein